MRDWLGLVARLVVGGVWLVAGLIKVQDPAGNVRAVRAFQILPESVVPTVGHLLPVVELAVGLLLLVGLLTRAAAVVSALMLVAFIIGIASAWARGLEIDCGCFGGGGFRSDAADAYPWDIARDVGLLVASGWLVLRPRSRFSLDAVLFPAPEVRHDEDERTPDVEEVR